MGQRPKLIPPDRSRCQALRPNGHSFMTFGAAVEPIRCSNPPAVIVKERDPDPIDGRRGSMSLCAECFATFKKRCPDKRVSIKQV